MTDAEKRKFVSDLYPGRKWKRLVDKMSVSQVFAIWKKEQLKLQPPDPKPKNDKNDIPF
jgi:hypothetical protein